MKINSIKQQPQQAFKGKDKPVKEAGKIFTKATQFIADKPGLVAALAGSSVVAQKIVMSGSEAVVGPTMDIGIGKAITAITGETDGRTNESSKVQAVRTFAQATGGTIVGVAVRLACIGAATAAITAACSKGGGKIAKAVADVVNPKKLNADNMAQKFDFDRKMTAWGKSIGGAAAIAVMLVTNFLIDAPFINWINKQSTKVVDKIAKPKNNEIKTEKEVK